MVDTQAPRIDAALWTVTVSSAIFISLRLYCKGRFKAVAGWDDIVLIFSWLLMLVYTILIHISITLGVGKHLLDIDPPNMVPALRLVYVAEFIIIIGCSLSKTSFAITLLRTVTRPWQKILVWWIIVTMNGLMFTCAILYFAQCNPVDRLWNLAITEGSCWDPIILTNFAIVAGAYSAAMDFVLAMLPWTFLMKLQMKKREKFGIAIAMSLGVFAGITAIIKSTYLPNIELKEDFTYYAADLLIWAGVETGVTMIAASIPFLRPLVRFVSSYGRSHGDSTNAFNDKGTGTGRHSKQRASKFSSGLPGKKSYKQFGGEGDDVELGGWAAPNGKGGNGVRNVVAKASFDHGSGSDTERGHDSYRPDMGGIQRMDEVTVSYENGSVITR